MKEPGIKAGRKEQTAERNLQRVEQGDNQRIGCWHGGREECTVEEADGRR